MISGWVLALAVCITAAAENVIELDMREDKSVEGRYVFFCSRYTREGSRNGDAFVIVSDGNSFDTMRVALAFGLHMQNDKMVLDTIPRKHIRSFAKRKGDSESHVLIVQADNAQYYAVKKIIEKWAAQEKYAYPIEVENTDMTLAIAKTLGLYPPYRRVWEPINPITYYVDLGKLNRGYAEK